MSKTHHPLRDETFVYYVCRSDPKKIDKDRFWIAMFSSQKYPMYFHGRSLEEVKERAELWRNSTVEREEKKYLSRVNNAEKARKRRYKNG